ncbi:unnamed protein product [Ilex paraguariensis]|uniref:Uncharacterized protein n=1 Tax=Ilex paraguariensis TaxID=185542 RepID=A0ABC8U5Q2_9AQUA
MDTVYVTVHVMHLLLDMDSVHVMQPLQLDSVHMMQHLLHLVIAHGHCLCDCSRDAPAAEHGLCSRDAAPTVGLCSHDAAPAALSHVNTAHDLNTKHGEDKDSDARDISSDKDKET